ncbi:MAG: hypothetical protein WCY98_04385 [Castellaniella sp.]
MKRARSRRERRMQIELVRLQARVERKALALEVQALQRAVTPAALGRSLLSSTPVRSLSHGMLMGLSRWSGLRRRYPLLLAAASSLLPLPGVRGRRGIVARLGLAVLAGLLVSRRLKRRGRAELAEADDSLL